MSGTWHNLICGVANSRGVQLELEGAEIYEMGDMSDSQGELKVGALELAIMAKNCDVAVNAVAYSEPTIKGMSNANVAISLRLMTPYRENQRFDRINFVVGPDGDVRSPLRRCIAQFIADVLTDLHDNRKEPNYAAADDTSHDFRFG